MDAFWQDLRYCFRMLRKSPGFTLVAILTLALGIGANTAIFSVVNAVLLNPFPFPDHERLTQLRLSMPKIGVGQAYRSSGPEFIDIRDNNRSFENLAAYEIVSRNLTGGEEPERIQAVKVSAEFFPVLGMKPAFGRYIQPEDQKVEAERVLVLSHGLWQRRFGGEPDVIGRKVALDDELYTIVGVMPQNFRFESSEAWFPMPFDLKTGPRQARIFLIMGRLKPGVSLQHANTELEAIARRQEQDFKSTMPEYEGRTQSMIPLLDYVVGTVKPTLYILLGAVALVLLIACANIANLLLARAVAREKEIAIRTALGASRFRVVKQILTESLVLSLIGGITGLLLALWGIDALATLVPEGSLPAGVSIKMNGQVLLFTASLSLITALLFGLWPALQVSRTNLNESLKEGSQKASVSHRSRRTQRILVISEVGLSLMLLVMAGLMIRSMAGLIGVDPGFDPKNVLTMRLNLSPTKYKGGQQNGVFFQQLIERVEKLPGVKAVGVASHTPFVYTENWTFTVEGQSQDTMQTLNLDTRTVSPGYFGTMALDFIRGDNFTPDDKQGNPGVVVINETMARRFWPNEDPIGKRIKLGRIDSKDPWLTIRGVVKDSAQDRLEEPINPEVYFPLAQMAWRYRRMNLAVRTIGDPMGMLESIRNEIKAIDKDQPVYQVQTLESMISGSIATRRFAMVLLLLFAVVALLLSAVGIYGVMAYTVTQRTHEIGIRLALGAQQRDVLILMVKQGMLVIGIGLALGIAGAVASTRLMSSLLYGVSATDPVTFVAVALLLAIIAFFSCYIPARRATKVDPMIALRYE